MVEQYERSVSRNPLTTVIVKRLKKPWMIGVTWQVKSIIQLSKDLLSAFGSLTMEFSIMLTTLLGPANLKELTTKSRLLRGKHMAFIIYDILL